MKHSTYFFSLLMGFTLQLASQPANNCQLLTNECGGLFLDPDRELCLTVICNPIFLGTPISFTECKPIVNGQACGFTNVPNSLGYECSTTWRITGFYGTVGGPWGNLTVKRWLAPTVKLDGAFMDSRIPYYEPNPWDSYYNFSHLPLVVCKNKTNTIDFNNYIMPGYCLNFEIHRVAGGHPRQPTGPVLASIVGIPYANTINIDALIDPNTVPINEDLIITIRSYCCGGSPQNGLNQTKYIYVKKTVAPDIGFEFMTSSSGDPLENSPGESNQFDGLENPSFAPSHHVALAPWSCGAFFPQYSNNQGISELKFEIWRAEDCTEDFDLLYSSGWVLSSQLPAQVNFNGLHIPGYGFGYFGINWTNNWGVCFKFVLEAKNPCDFAKKVAYFTFRPEIQGVKKPKEQIGSRGTSEPIDESGLPTRGLFLYPNPAKESIHLFSTENSKTFRLFSVSGKEIPIIYDGDNDIDISHLTPGLWIFEMTADDGKKYIQKFVKE